VLIPCLLGEGRSAIGNIWITGQFLVGRLAGYLLFAVLAWVAGRVLLPEGAWHDLLIGALYAAFAAMLIQYGFFKKAGRCKTGCVEKNRLLKDMGPASLPLAAGLATGLAFCPPFVLAFTGASQQASLWGSVLFFLAFFAGTSILFIPAPFVGYFKKYSALQAIGKMAAGLMGLYFLYSGIILLAGGICKL
jgi:hypothetical protein